MLLEVVEMLRYAALELLRWRGSIASPDKAWIISANKRLQAAIINRKISFLAFSKPRPNQFST
jgi:hypothetical protein